MSNQNRAPKGAPASAGGQFASGSHDDAPSALVQPWEVTTTDEKHARIERLILGKLAEHGHPEWTVERTRARSFAGDANFSRKVIRISTPAIEHLGEAFMQDTAMHEVGHVIAGIEAGHGDQWKALGAELGFNPKASALAVIPKEDKPAKTIIHDGVALTEGKTTFPWGNNMHMTVHSIRRTKMIVEDESKNRYFLSISAAARAVRRATA